MGKCYAKLGNDYSKLETYDKSCIGGKCTKYCSHYLDNHKIYIYDEKAKKYTSILKISDFHPQKTYDNLGNYFKEVARGCYNASPSLGVFFLVVVEHIYSYAKSRIDLKIRHKYEDSITYNDTTYVLIKVMQQ
jgi:hypothetical protein